ncbi:MAG TPA: fibronectin type III domain-containing protein [Candidatus Dormibacteraeota bacterium]|nr:fibronectin type III domain-containing protein [Candidatus Dormibacteraeota bacterium]
MRLTRSPRVFNVIWRAGAGAVAAGLLTLAGMSSGVPASAASLNVQIASTNEWQEVVGPGFTTVHLVGEVVNQDALDAGVIRLHYKLYDIHGAFIHDESFLTSDAGGAAVLAGKTSTAERTSYNYSFPKPANYGYALRDPTTPITAAFSQTPPDHDFAFSPNPPQPCDSMHPDPNDLCGVVQNLNPATVLNVRVILTFRSSINPSSTVDSESLFLQNSSDSSLQPKGTTGDSAPFEIVRPDGAPAYGSIIPQAESTTTPPTAPTGVVATAAPGQASVSWVPPASDGGSSLTSYTVTSSPGNVSTSVLAPTTSATVTGLSNGTTYTFTVVASNLIGPSHASAPSNPVTPATVPDPPSGVTAAAGITSASVSWAAPASNGGSPVTMYTVTSNPEAKTVTVDGSTLSATISGLAGGQDYTFTVVATNAIGNSQPSQASAPVFVPSPPPPNQPTAVTASAGLGYGTVNWTAPAPNAGGAITGYTVTASPGNATVNAGPAATSVIVGGLANGSYTFTVVASNINGPGLPSAPSNAVTVANLGGQFHPLTPARILDTRDVNIPVGEGQSRDVAVLGLGGVPKDGVSAVVINVTVTDPTASSYLTVYPSGQPPPTASNLNFVAGQSIPNLVIATLGDNGGIAVYNHTGSVQVVMDVQGWISTPQTTSGTSGLFRSLPPMRLMDTRTGQGGSHRLGQGQTVTLQVAGAGGVPTTGVSAVVLNVTAIGPSAPGYLSVLPGGPPLTQSPGTSSVNFSAGQLIPNRVIVPLSGGQIRIYNFQGGVDVVVDVNGWFTDGSDPSAILGQYTAMAPTRILDTRDPSNNANHLGPLTSGDTLILPVTAQGRCPAGSSSAVLNVTVTDTTAGSFLRVYPSDALAGTSDLNWTAGTVIPNLVMVRLSGADGTVAIYNLAGSADVIADLTGCFN